MVARPPHSASPQAAPAACPSPLKRREMSHGSGIRALKSRRRCGISRMQLVLLASLLAAAGLVGYGMFSRPDPSRIERPLTKVVSRGPFENVVTEQGEIESS